MFTKRHRLLRRLARVLVIVFVACAGAAGLLYLLPWRGTDALEELRFSRVFLDRHGSELYIEPVNEAGLRRMWTDSKDMPPETRRIVVAAEDRRFRFHMGVDLFSLMRATFDYVTAADEGGVSSVRGASTISMQLASMLIPRSGGVPGKIMEMADALRLELRLSKNEILELYLNLVPMGSNIEGFPAAAREFFHRDISELSVAELCALAVVPRAPSANDPSARDSAPPPAVELYRRFGSGGNMDWVYAQAAMLSSASPWPFEAPHFIRFLTAQIEERGMEEMSLKPVGPAPHGYDFSGWTIDTSLDLGIQHLLERRLFAAVEDARQHRISNAAGILTDSRTGEVLAYAGSADFSDEDGGQIDGVQILRQPGSTLKPFLFAAALDRGFSLSTVLPDLPLDFGGAEVYRPENFNEQYHGPVRLRQALASSLNIPAVYVLERISVDAFTEALDQLGFESLESQKDRLGVSLAVGGADVSLWELARAYRSLYLNGSYAPLVLLTDRRNPGGQAFAQSGSNASAEESPQVFSPASAALIRDVLSSHDERVMTFGRRSPLRFNFPVFVKTGTSNQFNNIWAAGYAADIGGAMWMGNFSGDTVIGAPGSSLPAELLHQLLNELSTGGPLPDMPAEVTVREICAISGLRAHEGCSIVIEEYFAADSVPEYCHWHDSRGRLRYPQEYASWAARYGYNLEFADRSELDILGPSDGAVFYFDPMIDPGSQQIRFYLMGEGRGVLRNNGALLYDGELPSEVFWQIRRGVQRFTLDSGGRRETRIIEVR